MFRSLKPGSITPIAPNNAMPSLAKQKRTIFRKMLPVLEAIAIGAVGAAFVFSISKANSFKAGKGNYIGDGAGEKNSGSVFMVNKMLMDDNSGQTSQPQQLNDTQRKALADMLDKVYQLKPSVGVLNIYLDKLSSKTFLKNYSTSDLQKSFMADLKKLLANASQSANDLAAISKGNVQAAQIAADATAAIDLFNKKFSLNLRKMCDKLPADKRTDLALITTFQVSLSKILQEVGSTTDDIESKLAQPTSSTQPLPPDVMLNKGKMQTVPSQGTQSNLTAQQYRQQAIDAVNHISDLSKQLISFSDWNNLAGFTALAVSLKDQFDFLSQSTVSGYVTEDQRKALGILIGNLKEAGLLGAANMTVDAAGNYASLSEAGKAVSAFCLEAASNIIRLNGIDMAMREYIFRGNYSKDKIIAAINDFGSTDDQARIKATEYAINAVYGSNLLLFKQAALEAAGIKAPDVTLTNSVTQNYINIETALAQNKAKISDLYVQAKDLNPEAAGLLVNGKVTVSVGGAGTPLNSVVPLGDPLLRDARPSYDMFSAIAGINLINSQIPFTFNVQSAFQLQQATTALVNFKDSYGKLNNLITLATLNSSSNTAIAYADFYNQYTTLIQSLKDQQASFVKAMPYGNPGLGNIEQGIKQLDNPDVIWKYATSGSSSDWATIQSYLLNLDSGFSTIQNSLQGANPSRDLFQQASGMQPSVAFALFENQDLFNKLYPDRSLVDVSTRNTLAQAILADMQLLYTTAPVQNRFAIINEFIANLSHLDFGTQNLVANFTNQSFGVRESDGMIYIKTEMITGGDNAPNGRGRSVMSFLESQLSRPQFSQFDPIQSINSVNFTTQSGEAGVLDQAMQMQREFRDRAFTKYDLSKFFFEGLDRKYQTDMQVALSKISNALESVMERKALPTITAGGPAFLSLGASGLQGASSGTISASDQSGKTIYGTKRDGTSSNASIGARDLATEGASAKNAESEAIGTASNYRLEGDALLRSLYAHYTSTLQEDKDKSKIFGFAWENVSTATQFDLNTSPYKDSDVLVHFNRHYSNVPSEGNQNTGSMPVATESYNDQANVYYRIGGTTWVKLIGADDVIRQSASSIADQVQSEQNVFAGTGSYDKPTQYNVGVQNLRSTDLQSLRTSGTDKDATDVGFYAGFGNTGLNTAVVGGTTTDKEQMAGVKFEDLRHSYALSYYKLNSINIGDVTNNNIVTGTNQPSTVNIGRIGRADEDKIEIGTFTGEQTGVFDTKDIMRGTISYGSMGSFGGGRLGYQSSDYVSGVSGSLVKGWGFFSWNPDKTLSAANYGTEGNFYSMPLAYLAQIRKYNNQDATRYTFAFQARPGTVDVELNGSFTNPQQLYQSIAQNAQNFDALTKAYAAYQGVLNDATLTDEQRDYQKKGALEGISNAMNSTFGAIDQYSLLRQLSIGTLSDVTFILRDKSGAPGLMLTFSSQIDQQLITDNAGNASNVPLKKTNLATLVNLTDNFALISSFDISRDGNPVVSSQNALAGFAYKAEDFKSLFVVQKVPPEVARQEFQAEGAVAYKDVMLDMTKAQDMWRVQFTLGSKNFQWLLNFTQETDATGTNFATGRTKGILYDDQMRYVLGLGVTSYNDITKLNAEGEIGRIGDVLGKPGYYGLGIRYEPMLIGGGQAKQNYLIYGKVSLGF